MSNLNIPSIDSNIHHNYSPSQWCKAISPELAIKNHTDTLKYKSQKAKLNLKYEEINYKNNPTVENKYILFRSKIESDVLLIYIHGGYWQMLNAADSCFGAEYFTKQNVNYAAIGYDTSPSVSLEEIVHQVRHCLITIMNNHDEFKHIFIMGHSAGAHLSLELCIFDNFPNELLFTENQYNKIVGLILISGIYDVKPICYTENNVNLKLTIDKAWYLSPMRNLEQLNKFNKMKIYVLVGEFDPLSFIEQSFELFKKLQSKWCIKYEIVHNKHHFDILHDIGNDDYEITKEIRRFIFENIK